MTQVQFLCKGTSSWSWSSCAKNVESISRLRQILSFHFPSFSYQWNPFHFSIFHYLFQAYCSLGQDSDGPLLTSPLVAQVLICNLLHLHLKIFLHVIKWRNSFGGWEVFPRNKYFETLSLFQGCCHFSCLDNFTATSGIFSASPVVDEWAELSTAA